MHVACCVLYVAWHVCVLHAVCCMLHGTCACCILCAACAAAPAGGGHPIGTLITPIRTIDVIISTELLAFRLMFSQHLSKLLWAESRRRCGPMV